MILSFTFQLKLFLVSICFGFFSSAIYNIFFVFSKTVKLNKIIKGLIDLIYWLLLSIMLFLIMLKTNFGEVRPFVILGCFLGMIFYLLLLKELMDKIIYKIFFFFKKFVLLLIEIILTPFKILFFPFRKILLFFQKKLEKKSKIWENILILIY